MEETIKNEVTTLLQEHVSVRDFTKEKLTEQEITTLVNCAQAASTASYLQAYSIISIDDPQLLEDIVEQGNLQKFILDAGHFFIFCGDFKRLNDFAKAKGIDIKANIEGTDALMVGAIDASLAAQNMVVAAESMGLGACYIGGVRDGIEPIAELLNLPDYVYPLYGLVLGHPKNKNGLKPRLPMEAVLHHNTYDRHTLEKTRQFEQLTVDYYAKRSGGKDKRAWSDTIFKTLLNLPRLYMKEFLNKRGLGKR